MLFMHPMTVHTLANATGYDLKCHGTAACGKMYIERGSSCLQSVLSYYYTQSCKS